MACKSIIKSNHGNGFVPNLQSYERTYRSFSWEQARKELDGLPEGGGLNIAYEAVDRHAANNHRDRIAIRWLGKNSGVKDYNGFPNAA
jgi:acetyl-CoA synthetase